MYRLLIPLSILSIVLLPQPAEVQAKGFKTLSTIEKVGRADIVVIGKVTGFEKETIEALPNVRAKEKIAHKVAVIAIQKRLIGGEGLTHIKVAFAKPPKELDPAAQGRPGVPRRIDLRQDQEGMYFITKHASGEFYTISSLMPPLDPAGMNYKAQVEVATKAAAVLADPKKALNADSVEERLFAATALITHYRGGPVDGREFEPAPIAAEESRLILKALADADWRYKMRKLDTDPIEPFTVYAMLGLTEKDGWVRPKAPSGGEIRTITKDEFVKWLDGQGKDYRIKKMVPKKVEK